MGGSGRGLNLKGGQEKNDAKRRRTEDGTGGRRDGKGRQKRPKQPKKRRGINAQRGERQRISRILMEIAGEDGKR